MNTQSDARALVRTAAGNNADAVTLDLRGSGFSVLFDGEWIGWEPAAAPEDRNEADTRWSGIDDADSLTVWEQAWSEDGISRGRFSRRLLQAPEIANRSRDAVGISNVLFLTGAPAGA